MKVVFSPTPCTFLENRNVPKKMKIYVNSYEYYVITDIHAPPPSIYIRAEHTLEKQRQGDDCLSPAWATKGAPGQPRLQCETLSKKKKIK